MTETTGISSLAEIRTSARGWQGVQLAVLGFIGLCGVLKGSAQSLPSWLEVLAGSLVLFGLALACVATALVAFVAWPVYATSTQQPDDQVDVRRTVGRLRTGIALTFVAVTLTALATASQWWPAESESSSALVVVSTADREVCGELQQIDTSGVALTADGRAITIGLSEVVSLRSVSTC